MASEIRVDKINSLSGVGTVTLSPTGVDISGITTAATLKATTGIVTTLTATTGIVTTLTTNTTRATTGIVTTLTATTGIVTTLTTNTLTANSTAKVGSGVTLSPDGDVFVTGVTTSSTVNVGAAVTISESGIEASGIGITCANINGTQIGGRRNLIINGAMQVAQRGTSSTTSGFGSVDRFNNFYNGTDEAPTHSQVDVASGTTPYSLGLKKALKFTNGNQTGGAGVADYINIQQTIEAQNIASSGWNYTSSSSYVTLSFWIKSSVAQSFKGYLRSRDGTEQRYPFDTGSLSANTWTKVTKTISGDSNLQFDSNNGAGLQINIGAFWGGNFTNNSVTENVWAADASSTRMKDNTSTWYTTNDATLEITGMQLEVGPQATPFEHRPYAEEFKLCQRYYQDWQDWTHPAQRGLDSNYDGHIIIDTLRIDMRANPTITNTSYGWIANGSSWVDGSASEAASIHNDPSSDYPGRYVKITGSWSWDTNSQSTIAVKFVTAKFDAEL